VIGVLALSYCSAAILLHSFADYDRWSRVPEGVRTLPKAAIGKYLAGQVAIWWRTGLAIYDHE
jgi:hypothetical protein